MARVSATQTKTLGLGKSLVIGAGTLISMAAVSSALAMQAEYANPPLGKFIVVDGVRLHYVERGTGEPVVFLHGNGSMIQDFDSSGVLDLVAREHRVIAFDRPGFGHSDRPTDRDWGPREQAALFARALTQLGVVRPTVVGHSWGTLVAVAMAIHHPEAVGGLVLLSGYYYASLRADTALSAPGAAPFLGSLIQYTLGPLIGRLSSTSAVEHMFKPRAVPQAFWDEYSVGLAVRPSQLKAAAAETVMMPFVAAELSERYAEIRLPVAIIAGADDAIVDTNMQSGRLHENIAGSTFTVVPGVGHMVHHAVPSVVADALTIRQFAA
jgi:pimeloyl-ACP methyl ester carboxylesterase